MANNLIIGYTHPGREPRLRGASFFPFVDILEGGTTYTSFGFEPFTPNNELRYNTFQLQDNFTRFSGHHTLTFGASAEKYHSDNMSSSPARRALTSTTRSPTSTPTRTTYLANPNRTTSPVTLRRVPGPLGQHPGDREAASAARRLVHGGYAQDEWQAATEPEGDGRPAHGRAALRRHGLRQPDADTLTFRDENGQTVTTTPAKLPGHDPLWSPRLGFNWDVNGDQTTQVRGGTGVFTGQPGLRLDLEPDRQHGHADRLRAS